jgi:hypothetical protein
MLAAGAPWMLLPCLLTGTARRTFMEALPRLWQSPVLLEALLQAESAWVRLLREWREEGVQVGRSTLACAADARLLGSCCGAAMEVMCSCCAAACCCLQRNTTNLQRTCCERQQQELQEHPRLPSTPRCCLCALCGVHAGEVDLVQSVRPGHFTPCDRNAVGGGVLPQLRQPAR